MIADVKFLWSMHRNFAAVSRHNLPIFIVDIINNVRMVACYYELNISIRMNNQIGYRINTFDAKTINGTSFLLIGFISSSSLRRDKILLDKSIFCVFFS